MMRMKMFPDENSYYQFMYINTNFGILYINPGWKQQILSKKSYYFLIYCIIP